MDERTERVLLAAEARAAAEERAAKRQRPQEPATPSTTCVDDLPLAVQALEHADASIGHIDQQDTPQLLRFFRERRVVRVRHRPGRGRRR